MVVNVVVKYIKNTEDDFKLFIIKRQNNKEVFQKLLDAMVKIEKDGYKVGDLYLSNTDKNVLFLKFIDKFNAYKDLNLYAYYKAKLYTKTNNEYVNFRLQNKSFEFIRIDPKSPTDIGCSSYI